MTLQSIFLYGRSEKLYFWYTKVSLMTSRNDFFQDENKMLAKYIILVPSWELVFNSISKVSRRKIIKCNENFVEYKSIYKKKVPFVY